jgi:hypothetical protein
MNETTATMSITAVLTMVALILNIIMLGIVAYQTWLTRKSLDVANQSIQDARTTRQIELLGKHHWVIHVMVELELWQKSIRTTGARILEAATSRNAGDLKSIAAHGIHSPSQLSLRNYDYENMPTWLREIWLSGAQYYYNAICCVGTVWSEKPEPDYYFSYAKKLVEERFAHSDEAISTLRGYIVNMIPQVILNTPASISDEEFLRKD